jgi:hypothetical protein
MVKRIVRKVLGILGYELVRKRTGGKITHPSEYPYPIEFSKTETALIDYVYKHMLTMTSRERLFATLMSCKYVCESGIEGDFVECGVWRGGNSIIAAGVFDMYRDQNRKVYLYDTFSGFDGIACGKEDYVLHTGLKDDLSSKKFLRLYGKNADINQSCVKQNFEKAGLLSENIVFVKGNVMETLDHDIPNKIAVLRLDTDWYESTQKEMRILYPRISANGIFMSDDYGHCAGHKQAIDEYFSKNRNRPFMQYIDYAGRLAIKAEIRKQIQATL